ncbi:LOW QUALITY PROTEIN: hypothetical protein MAR_018041 [Mya arenaria]|uniref:DDE Tnp4 domain-containing protein n=1 Tax=Mya arenaria TaxID=6604 RepID=A0ABY7EDJ8_MYAAR|nr:LOW QUALITY PROTEIN: hypothetical protein MAR_018041 [Mya arenaria]
MLVRCNTDSGAELFRSSYLTLSVHHYGCTEETSNGTARTRTSSSKVPVQPGPGGNTRSRREGATEGPQKRMTLVEWILRRPLFGHYETLMKELEAKHAADFKAFLRMEPQMYYELLNRVGPRITKSTTRRLSPSAIHVKALPSSSPGTGRADLQLPVFQCTPCGVENAFGILANRFRCLPTTLGMRPSTVTKTVMACMTLHNLMRTRYPNIQNADLDREDEQGQFIAGAWRDQAVLEDVQAAGNGPRLTGPGKELRAYLKNYFCSPAGSVPCQDVAINHVCILCNNMHVLVATIDSSQDLINVVAIDQDQH